MLCCAASPPATPSARCKTACKRVVIVNGPRQAGKTTLVRDQLDAGGTCSFFTLDGILALAIRQRNEYAARRGLSLVISRYAIRNRQPTSRVVVTFGDNLPRTVRRAEVVAGPP